MKTCSACGKSKPFTEYHKRSSAKDGLESYCKECAHARNKAWYQSHRQHVVAKTKKWKREHPRQHREQLVRSNRAYKSANRTELLEKRRAEYDPVESSMKGHKQWADTISTATNWGGEWTGTHVEIALRRDITVREIAKMLGRTYGAIIQIRQKVKREDPRTMALLGHDIY